MPGVPPPPLGLNIDRCISYGLSFFPVDLWPEHKACGPSINRKQQGSVTHSTDCENEVSKIFIIIISLKLIGLTGKETS